jgi:hypothetical protein
MIDPFMGLSDNIWARCGNASGRLYKVDAGYLPADMAADG